MKTIEINGVTEQIIERSDYPIERQRAILGDEVTAVLGYGPQGRGQSLNLRDQGFNVLIGVRPGRSMDRALEDGWEEGENLLSIEDAAEQGSIVQYLLSDAAQIAMWPEVSSGCVPATACTSPTASASSSTRTPASCPRRPSTWSWSRRREAG